MKLRMLLSLAGSDFALSRGDETERFGDAEALRLIEAAYAVLVLPPPADPVAAPAAIDIPDAPGDELPLAGASAIEGVAPLDETASTEDAATIEPAAVEAPPSGTQPLLVEDVTERAVRNPARKRRG
jgi:hypothetical protein